MSFVMATPEFVTAAASDLANIGSAVNAAHAVASRPATAVVAVSPTGPDAGDIYVTNY